MKSKLVLIALLAAAFSFPQVPEGHVKPLTRDQIWALLASSVPNQRIADLVGQRGIDFEPTDDYMQMLRGAGAEDVLLDKLRAVKPAVPPKIDPAVVAKQDQIQTHLAHGKKLLKEGFYSEAEQEFRAALALDPDSAFLHYALGHALIQQNKDEAALPELREAVRLDDDPSEAHYDMSRMPRSLVDLPTSLAHARKALSLRPDFAEAHYILAELLDDPQASIAEYREAIGLKPDYFDAYSGLSYALQRVHDGPGAVSAAREAVRLSPSCMGTHIALGNALMNSSEFQEAGQEFIAAMRYDDEFTGLPDYQMGQLFERLADSTKNRAKANMARNTAVMHYRQALETAHSHNRPASVQNLYQVYLDNALSKLRR